MQRRRAAAERHDDHGPPADLYRQDFYAWASGQARALHRAGEGRARGDAGAVRDALSALDFDNLAEELDSLGRSELRELRHRLTTIVEHLLKLQFSPAEGPRAGWRSTVRRGRIEVARLLEDSPSLKAELLPSLNKAKLDAGALVLAELESHGEVPVKLVKTATLTVAVMEALLGDHTLERVQDRDWWPGDPQDALTEATGAYSARFPGQEAPLPRSIGDREEQWAAVAVLRMAVKAGTPLDEETLKALDLLQPPPPGASA